MTPQLARPFVVFVIFQGHIDLIDKQFNYETYSVPNRGDLLHFVNSGFTKDDPCPDGTFRIQQLEWEFPNTSSNHPIRVTMTVSPI